MQVAAITIGRAALRTARKPPICVIGVTLLILRRRERARRERATSRRSVGTG